MSTASNMQQVLGFISTSRVEGNPAQGAARLADQPTYAEAVQSGRAPAWDPHEVWLNRVKLPREQRSAG